MYQYHKYLNTVSPVSNKQNVIIILLIIGVFSIVIAKSTAVNSMVMITILYF